LVVNFYGVPNLVIPPIDPADKCSLDLKMAQFLRRFRIDNANISKYLNAEIETASE